MLQEVVSVFSPSQAAPSLIAGVSTSLVLCFVPAPQVVLHVGHSVQTDQTHGQGCSSNLQMLEVSLLAPEISCIKCSAVFVIYLIVLKVTKLILLSYDYFKHIPFPLICNFFFFLLQFDILLI